jgi:hypothetical protein
VTNPISFTHFTASVGRTFIYTVDTCKKCGELTMRDCVTTPEIPQRLRVLGLEELEIIPAEQYADDAVCADCAAWKDG